MLNGDGNENGIKINRSNQQKKTNLHVQHTVFFSNQQKINVHVQHAFFFLISKNNKFARAALFFVFLSRCLARPTMPFCTNKTSNQFLVTHYFYGGIVLYTYQRFCFCVHVHFYFFTAAHFHLAGLQYFSFSHLRHEIFMFFFQRNFSPLFSITRSSSFSVIHVNVNIENNVEKDTNLLLFFLSL